MGINIIFLQICIIIVILIVNFQSVKPKLMDYCLTLNGAPTCHSLDSNPYRFYSTKTTYYEAVGNNTQDKFEAKGCEPKIFYLLSRHAIRYPDRDDIEDMAREFPIIKMKINNSSSSENGTMCEEDIKRINQLNLGFVPNDDNKLSLTGKAEAFELAQRLKQKFPSILDRKYSDIKFEHTSRDRTLATAESFADGLFGDDYKNIFAGNINDDVLQFHKNCKALGKNCTGSKVDLKELKSFEKGPVMEKMILDISRRIGFSVSKDEIDLMYKACSFGYALDAGDAWCSVFSTDNLKVLEFENDLDDYYKDAYGNEVNYKQACPVAKHVTSLFRSHADGEKRKVVLQFSHAGAVKKVYPLFGLFRDKEPLTADGICTQEDREWKSSLIAPFASNMELVLYQCGAEQKVVAFHNEKPVVIKGCSSEWCPLQDFYDTYEPISKECDLESLCCKN